MYCWELSGIKTPTFADEDVYEVYEKLESGEKGRWIGRVAKGGGGWVKSRHSKGTDYRIAISYRVVGLPAGVDLDDTTRYEGIEEACDAVVDAITSDGRHVRGEDGLSQFEKDLIDFQSLNLIDRVTAMHDLLKLNETRYHQLLAELIKRPEALKYNPVVVNRLRERVARRAAHRARTSRLLSRQS